MLLDGGRDLSEEGVGIGVPVLKRGLQAVFPGAMTLAVRADGPAWRVTATYRMDLVERLGRRPRRPGALAVRLRAPGTSLAAAASARPGAARAAHGGLERRSSPARVGDAPSRRCRPWRRSRSTTGVAEGGSVVTVAVGPPGRAAGAAHRDRRDERARGASLRPLRGLGRPRCCAATRSARGTRSRRRRPPSSARHIARPSRWARSTGRGCGVAGSSSARVSPGPASATRSVRTGRPSATSCG